MPISFEMTVGSLLLLQNHNLLFMFTILYVDLFRSWGEDNFIKSKNDQYVKIWMKISSRISEFMILSYINIYL